MNEKEVNGVNMCPDKAKFEREDFLLYDETVLYYDGIAKGYDELHFDEQAEKFRILKQYLVLPVGAKVLDVGCGTFFSQKYFTEWDMQGIEPSSKMVDVFAEKNPAEKSRISVGFAEELTEVYGAEAFDAVICVSVAHHFVNSQIAFKQIKKVCKKRGLIGITLLKNTRGFASLQEEIGVAFEILHIIESHKDLIFICVNK